jgi:nucleoid-associated protein YgaU
MGAIKFWLYNRKEKETLILPVNPESLRVSNPFGYTDVEVAQLGQVSVPGNRGLSEYSFSSFFPSIYNESYCEYTPIPIPWDAVNKIEKWRDNKTPIQLTVTGTPISAEVSIRDFDLEIEKAGSPGDIYFSMTLKDFVSSAPKQTVTTNTLTKSATTRSSSKSVPKTYTVKAGDSLSKIALKYYGKTDYWRKIYDKNKKLIGNNPNKISAGMKLVMP